MNLIHDSIIPYPVNKSVIARVCWVHTTEILPASRPQSVRHYFFF